MDGGKRPARGYGYGEKCWESTGQRFQVELTKTVTDGSPRTEKDTKYVST